MAIAMAIQYISAQGSQLRVGFTLTPSGNYPTGGDTVDFTTATQDPEFVGPVAAVEAFGPPLSLDIWSDAGNTALGYFPIEGTTNKNCKVKIVTAFNTEASAGAYSSVAASALTDSIVGEATFNKL
jgi:hypothetical protein